MFRLNRKKIGKEKTGHSEALPGVAESYAQRYLYIRRFVQIRIRRLPDRHSKLVHRKDKDVAEFCDLFIHGFAAACYRDGGMA